MGAGWNLPQSQQLPLLPMLLCLLLLNSDADADSAEHQCSHNYSQIDSQFQNVKWLVKLLQKQEPNHPSRLANRCPILILDTARRCAMTMIQPVNELQMLLIVMRM